MNNNCCDQNEYKRLFTLNLWMAKMQIHRLYLVLTNKLLLEATELSSFCINHEK